MITKITPETTVKEICGLLEFMNTMNEQPCSIELFSDISGGFTDKNNYTICKIYQLPKYLKENKPEKDYDAILSDPTAVKKILSKLPIGDILIEMNERYNTK